MFNVKSLLLWFVILNPVFATDYIGRLGGAEPQKGGESSLASEDAGVSPMESLDDSAPVVPPAVEASESRSPLPDETAPQPFSFIHELHLVNVCYGSCIYLGDGLFLTAKHVINDAPAKTVIKIDGVQYGGKRVWIKDHDVGYLQMDGIPSDWPAAKVALPDLMAAPTAVTLCGKTTGEHPAISDTEKKFSNESVALNLQDSSSVDSGDSGGGAFDEHGNLVGIIVEKMVNTHGTATLDDDTNLPVAMIVPLAVCHEDLPISYLIPPSETAPTPPMESANSEFEYLLFSASWCAACRVVKASVLPEIEKAMGKKVTIVDTDAEPEKATKYNISSLPTWVLLKNGVEVYRESYGSVKSLMSHVK